MLRNRDRKLDDGVQSKEDDLFALVRDGYPVDFHIELCELIEELVRRVEGGCLHQVSDRPRGGAARHGGVVGRCCCC